MGLYLILVGETECSKTVNFTFIILKRAARLPLFADILRQTINGQSATACALLTAMWVRFFYWRKYND
jgi:hypothetical protein